MTAPHHGPPGWVRSIFRRLLGNRRGSEALDDLDREYRIVRARRGPTIAGTWYVAQLLRPDTWQLVRALRRLQRPPPSGLSRHHRLVWIPWLDLRVGVRMLLKHPGLTIVATLALGVGIPAGLAPGHVARVERAALPVHEGERIRVLRYLDPATGHLRTPFIDEFREWRGELSSWRSLALASIRRQYNVVTVDGRSEPVQGAAVTPSFFEILEVPPLLGRPLLGGDDIPGAPGVVVIGYALWRSRFEADPEAVGREVRIGGIPRTVVGVMPEDFRFPFRDELWLPIQSTDGSVGAGEGLPFQGATSLVFGRLKDGVSAEQAEAELAAARDHWLARRSEPIRAAPGVEYSSLRPQVVPFLTGLFAKPAAGVPAGAEVLAHLLGLLVLAVACANVGSLVFARTAARNAELTVRTALGASRRRIVFQLFVEALMMALVATGLGLLAADVAVSRLLESYLETQPYWLTYGISLETMLWALILAAGSAIIAGTIPALRVTGVGLRTHLGRADTGTPIRFGGVSGVLTVMNVALAVATVGIGASLWLGRSNLVAASAELAPQLVMAELAIPSRAVPQEPITKDMSVEEWGRAYTDKVLALRAELVRRLEADPRILEASLADVLPGTAPAIRHVEVEGGGLADVSRPRRVHVTHVQPGFFEAMGRLPLLGRRLDAADLRTGAPAIVAGSSFVRQVVRERNPVGWRVRYTNARGDPLGPWYEIVGVVDDAGLAGAVGIEGIGQARAEGSLYLPLTDGSRSFGLIARIDAPPQSFAQALRRLITEIDPSYIVSAPRPVQIAVADAQLRANAPINAAVLLTVFLVVLAAASTYALMSFTVSQRRREIGVRTALGAQRYHITRLVALRSLGQLGIGSLVGAPLAWQILRGVEVPGLGGSHLALAVLLAVGVALVVGMLACTGPVMRALRVAPSETLQADA